jgi:hypothetical protein
MRISVLSMKQLTFAAAIAAAACCISIPSQAADLGADVRHGARHARISSYYGNWRDRCAFAGYYCLYAWDGYVYHYPWDDRPSAYAYSARRHHSRVRY